MHVYEHSHMVGRVELAGLNLSRCDRGTHDWSVFGSTLTKNGVAIRPAGLVEAPEQIGRRCHAQKDDVESHQGYARVRQRTEGHDSQRMLEHFQ